ncbi:MAG: hypothetical protein RR405_06065, partial [Clostridia bacterium]
TNMYAYEQQKDGKFAQKPINIDIKEGNPKFGNTLPDLVRVRFLSGGTWTFGTLAMDAAGKPLTAISYKKVKDEKNPNTYKYVAETLGTVIDPVTKKPVIDPVTKLPIDILNADGNNFKLVPAYKAAVMRDGTGEYDYATGEYNGTKYSYAKIDSTKLPEGRAFPAGSFSWDTKDFTYDWGGGILNLDYTYQWGFGKPVKATASIDVPSYKMSKITSFVKADGNIKNFEELDSFTMTV